MESRSKAEGQEEEVCKKGQGGNDDEGVDWHLECLKARRQLDEIKLERNATSKYGVDGWHPALAPTLFSTFAHAPTSLGLDWNVPGLRGLESEPYRFRVQGSGFRV